MRQDLKDIATGAWELKKKNSLASKSSSTSRLPCCDQVQRIREPGHELLPNTSRAGTIFTELEKTQPALLTLPRDSDTDMLFGSDKGEVEYSDNWDLADDSWPSNC